MLIDFFKDKFNLTDEDIYKGMLEAKNPGRLQLISTNPRILVDGSHNKEAIDALASSIKNYNYDKLIVGFSILEDKDYHYVINKLTSIADEIVVTEIKDNPRAFELDELYSLVKSKLTNTISIKDNIEAFEYTKNTANENDWVVWCGSLYLIGDILKYNS